MTLRQFLSLLQCSLNLEYKDCVKDVTTGDGYSVVIVLCIFTSMDFCHGLCLMQREASLIGVGATVTCKDQYLDAVRHCTGFRKQ